MAALSGKRAWITGAGSAIGAATARVLARNGAEVCSPLGAKTGCTRWPRKVMGLVTPSGYP